MTKALATQRPTVMQLGGWWRLFIATAVVWGLVSAVYTVDRRSQQLAEFVTLKGDWIEQECGAGGDHPSLEQQAACKRAQETSVLDMAFPAAAWLGIFALVWIAPLLLALVIIAIGRWVARGFRRAPESR